MHTLDPLFARLTLGFSLAGFLAISVGVFSGQQYPNLIMELGFASVLAAWLSWGLSEINGRLARATVPVQRHSDRRY
jgi:hypothetical protein